MENRERRMRWVPRELGEFVLTQIFQITKKTLKPGKMTFHKIARMDPK